ncbi:unnamed protein product [Amoebophrya sp. A120]|nr:unnamed protein product [Amoebophrya sp. A120]|eukprot:GSA120T00008714001.1
MTAVVLQLLHEEPRHSIPPLPVTGRVLGRSQSQGGQQLIPAEESTPRTLSSSRTTRPYSTTEVLVPAPGLEVLAAPHSCPHRADTREANNPRHQGLELAGSTFVSPPRTPARAFQSSPSKNKPSTADHNHFHLETSTGQKEPTVVSGTKTTGVPVPNKEQEFVVPATSSSTSSESSRRASLPEQRKLQIFGMNNKSSAPPDGRETKSGVEHLPKLGSRALVGSATAKNEPQNNFLQSRTGPRDQDQPLAGETSNPAPSTSSSCPLFAPSSRLGDEHFASWAARPPAGAALRTFGGAAGASSSSSGAASLTTTSFPAAHGKISGLETTPNIIDTPASNKQETKVRSSFAPDQHLDFRFGKTVEELRAKIFAASQVTNSSCTTVSAEDQNQNHDSAEINSPQDENNINYTSSNLKSITFAFNTSFDPGWLDLVKNFEYIDLNHLQNQDNADTFQDLKDEHLLQVLDQNPTLKELQLYWNPQLTDKSLSQIAVKCRQLERLSIAGCVLATDVTAVEISKHLGGTSAGQGTTSSASTRMVPPAKMPSVTGGAAAPGATIASTSSSPMSQNSSRAGLIQPQLAAPPHLRHLDLTRCPKISSAGVRKILRRCKTLEVLRVYANAHLLPDAFPLENVPNLELLDVCGTQISDDNLATVGRKLKVLNLSWCVHITDSGVKALCDNVESLEELSVFGNLNLTDRAVDYLGSKFRDTLTTLDINGCTNVKHRTPEYLLTKLPHLRVFQVHS